MTTTTMNVRGTPLDHRCHICGAVPGDPCQSTNPDKIKRSHMSRQDKMIHAQWEPPVFGVWLTRQLDRSDPVGDLARDVRDDQRSGCMRRAPRTAVAVRRHLSREHEGNADQGAMTALSRAENEHAEAVRSWLG